MSTLATTTKLQPPAPANKPSALNLMAARLDCDPAKLLAALKSTVFKGANDEELMALVIVSNEYDLNPFLREIYAFPAKGGGVAPIVSVDGWNKMLIRQPAFNGVRFDFEFDERRFPVSCTATVHVRGREHPVVVTEFFDECQRNTENWKSMPRRMLRNRTLCQAARLAFGFSGVHHEEEVPPVREIESAVVAAAEPPARMIAAPATTTPQAELEAFILSNGFTFETFLKFAAESGTIPEAAGLTRFAEVATDDARRVLRGKAKMLELMALVEGGAR